MNIVAIVTARGGSKRLPRKNMKLFCGEPLVWWTLQACRWSKRISQTWLTTDDAEIAAVGDRAGINVFRREVQPDDTTAGVPISQLIRRLKRQKIPMDAVITPLVTSPQRQPDEFDKAIAEYERRLKIRPILGLGGLVPLKEVSLLEKINDEQAKLAVYNKTWRYLFNSGSWGIMKPDYYIKMVESNGENDKDIDKKVEVLAEKGKVEITEYMELPRYHEFDIDYQEDFDLCELFMEHYILKGNPNVYEEYYRSVT